MRFLSQNRFENDVRKMAALWSRPHFVNWAPTFSKSIRLKKILHKMFQIFSATAVYLMRPWTYLAFETCIILSELPYRVRLFTVRKDCGL